METALISRLAKELFSGAMGEANVPTVPVSLPRTAAGVPTEIPANPLESPVAPGGGRDIALSGGFPNASAASAPPVHPTVVAAEPEPAAKSARPPSGAHHPGDGRTHEFGEPSFYTRGLNSRVEAPAAKALPIGELGLPGISAEPQFYFLKDLPGVNAFSSFGTQPSPFAALPEFNIEGVRKDFPALQQHINGNSLVWLDNAATTHKPQAVIDATSRFYSRDNSNIHRAAHTLAARSTELFEGGREKVRQFLGAGDAKEIVFVRGTTEAINLVAQSWGRQNIGEGDEILLSQLEHHANIVPWQILAGQLGATLRMIPINDRGELLIEELPKLLTDRTKIVSVTQVSNALGTVNPVEEIIAMAHARGIPVLVDGAQSTPHLPINVQAMDADFFVFSGHKVFAPTGIGALYGKPHLLEAMPPWQGGGHMIKDVSFEKTVFNAAPEKFEAGTPDIAGVVGLGAAIDYMMGLGIPALAAYEHSLLEYAEEALRSVRGVRPIGTASHKASVFGFVIPGVPNERVAKYLDQQGIAVRAGHHCAMPAVRHFGGEGTVRPSLAFYNNRADVDTLIQALHQIARR
ncbi:SufS family cysteine desulfurase [Haloferula sp. BvORR071]|uniref:SufS family cysteine desulfurase n=1 Tax=Haloferula sp. BvORR071 TaxID=1396141 RepID=UPI0009467E38|nr:SufS family cysteine desulfurase [Haloferula sp. BvORR071]